MKRSEELCRDFVELVSHEIISKVDDEGYRWYWQDGKGRRMFKRISHEQAELLKTFIKGWLDNQRRQYCDPE